MSRIIANVFVLPWAFISGASTLEDFAEDDDAAEAVATHRRRIREVFGVDVSAIESGNIAEIARVIGDDLGNGPQAGNPVPTPRSSARR